MTVGNINTFISQTQSAPTPAQGASLQLLDTHVASATEANYTFTPGSALSSTNYSEIIVIISGSNTAQLAIQMVVSGKVGTSNYYIGQRMTGSAVANITASAQASIQLLSSTALATANAFDIEVHITLDSTVLAYINGWSKGMSGQNLIGEDMYFNNITSGNTLTSLKFQTSTSTWDAGTTITTYGLKRA